MQVCPAFNIFPKIIRCNEFVKLADLVIYAGDFPPNSRVVGVKFFAAYFATSLPTLVEPVKNK